MIVSRAYSVESCWNLLQSGFVKLLMSTAHWNAKPEIPKALLTHTGWQAKIERNSMGLFLCLYVWETIFAFLLNTLGAGSACFNLNSCTALQEWVLKLRKHLYFLLAHVEVSRVFVLLINSIFFKTTYTQPRLSSWHSPRALTVTGFKPHSGPSVLVAHQWSWIWMVGPFECFFCLAHTCFKILVKDAHHYLSRLITMMNELG